MNHNVGAQPASISASDLNNDGLADIVTANSNDSSVSVLLAGVSSTFQSAVRYAVGNTPSGVGLAQLENNGISSIVVANTADNTVGVLDGRGDGTFSPQILFSTGPGPVFVLAADLNQDGKLDLATADSTGHNVTILFGKTITNGVTVLGYESPAYFSTGSQPSSLALGDFDGDGKPDLAIANSGESNVSILLGIASLRFVPIVPCRVADTRLPANGDFGPPSITGQSTRDFLIPTSTCSVPGKAQAYSLNVTVVPQGPLGYLTVWPTGQPQPFTSTLNSSDGRTKSNAAIVPAGNNGAISVFASNTTDLVLDINGYFVQSYQADAMAFYPVAPCRVSDTRHPVGPFGGPFLAGQSRRSLTIPSSSCGIPATAQAYSLNLTAVPRLGTLGYLTAWPDVEAQPSTSSLNAPTGTTTANAAIVVAGFGNRAVDVFASNDTDLVVDINGYFALPAAGGLSLYNLPPCRVTDTRSPAGSLPFTGALPIPLTGPPCGTPAAAQAFVVNATVVPAQSFGYLTLWPQGAPQPFVSTLNASDGAITSNFAIVPTFNGSIEAFGSNSTYLILDLLGYFAP